MKTMRGTCVNLSYQLLPGDSGEDKHLVVPMAQLVIITTEPRYGVKTDPDTGERVMVKTENVKDVRLDLTIAQVKQLTTALLNLAEDLEEMERVKIVLGDRVDVNANTTPATTDGIPSTNDVSHDAVRPGDEVVATTSEPDA